MHSCSLLGSLLVDQMWHQHILDVVVVVVNYCHDMMLLCGRVVGHNHDGALDVAGKRVRDMRTQEVLDQYFEGEYDREVWGIQETGNLTIRVRDQMGEETFYRVRRNTQMRNVFNA